MNSVQQGISTSPQTSSWPVPAHIKESWTLWIVFNRVYQLLHKPPADLCLHTSKRVELCEYCSTGYINFSTNLQLTCACTHQRELNSVNTVQQGISTSPQTSSWPVPAHIKESWTLWILFNRVYQLLHKPPADLCLHTSKRVELCEYCSTGYINFSTNLQLTCACTHQRELNSVNTVQQGISTSPQTSSWLVPAHIKESWTLWILFNRVYQLLHKPPADLCLHTSKRVELCEYCSTGYINFSTNLQLTCACTHQRELNSVNTVQQGISTSPQTSSWLVPAHIKESWTLWILFNRVYQLLHKPPADLCLHTANTLQWTGSTGENTTMPFSRVCWLTTGE